MNYFNQDLEYSQEKSLEPFWDAIYKKAFPEMEWHQPCNDNGNGQYRGIDRVVYLRSGKVIFVDEKKRRKTYPDIALEVKHKFEGGKESSGWMEKGLLIDFLAYAFIPIKTAYLFPWQLLKRTWEAHKKPWIKQYGLIPAENPGYTTYSVPVPIEILLNKLKVSMIIELKG